MVQYANKVRKCQASGKTWRCRRWVELVCSQAEFPKLLNVKELTFSMTLLAVKCLANGHTNSSVLGMMSKKSHHI